MTEERPRFGKTSMYTMLRHSLQFKICDVFDVYDFSTEHYESDVKGLHEWADRRLQVEGEAQHLVDNFVDESERLKSVKRLLGYSTAILLGSVTEEGISAILSRIKRDDPSIAKEYKQHYKKLKGASCYDNGPSFLEKYVHFHRDKFDTDFFSDITPIRLKWQNRGILPDGLQSIANLSVIDVKLLLDFIWARNLIVHERGRVKPNQEERLDGRRRDVVLNGGLDLEEGSSQSRRAKIEIRREYLERVTQHLLAFFTKVLEDLRSRYE